jgi:GH35 family endo-1,4-beta-xylanase
LYRYIKQIRDLIDRGAPVTGIGVQAHLGPNSIDLAKVEKALDDLWNNFQLPIWYDIYGLKMAAQFYYL